MSISKLLLTEFDEEMKNYDFYTRWGHKLMKDYVFNYYRDLSNKQTENQVTDSTNQ